MAGEQHPQCQDVSSVKSQIISIGTASSPLTRSSGYVSALLERLHDSASTRRRRTASVISPSYDTTFLSHQDRAARNRLRAALLSTCRSSVNSQHGSSHGPHYRLVYPFNLDRTIMMTGKRRQQTSATELGGQGEGAVRRARRRCIIARRGNTQHGAASLQHSRRRRIWSDIQACWATGIRKI